MSTSITGLNFPKLAGGLEFTNFLTKVDGLQSTKGSKWRGLCWHFAQTEIKKYQEIH